MQTVVTVSAIILFIGFTEVMQQHLSTTNRSLGICSGLNQQLTTDILFCHRFTLHEFIKLLQVLIRIKGQTDTLATITTSTTGFLIIAFQRLWYVVMDHKTHIRFIDTHTKGNSCHNNVDILHQELILSIRTCVRIQSCVIGGSLDIISTQNSSQLLHLLS